MNEVLGIVVIYNPSHEVVDNIKSYSSFCKEVLVIDNSDKIDKDIIVKLKKISNLKYVSLNGNCGLAKALNVGCEYGIKNRYKWVLTMDQDSKFENNIIKTMFDGVTKLKKVAIISPNYYFDRKRNFVYEGYKEKGYVMQSGNLLSLDVFRKTGKFKEEFFIDGVDYEYCFRLNQLGYSIYECGEAILHHNPGITKKFIFIKYGYCSPLRIYYQVRNLLWINKEYKSIKMLIILLYKLIKILFLFDHKKEFLIMYKKGIIDYKNNRFGKYGE